MFSIVMLILKLLRSRFHIRIDQLAAGSHLGNLFQNYCIMHCLVRILAPCERTMILAKNSRNSLIISLLEIVGNENASILLISFRNLTLIQITDERNLTVNIISMSGSIAWNCAAGLCPAGSPGGMSMYNSTDLQESIVQNYMGRSIR